MSALVTAKAEHFSNRMLNFAVGESAGQSELLQQDPLYSSATAEVLIGHEYLLFIQQLLEVNMK